MQSESRTTCPLRLETDLAYQAWGGYPGRHLSVLDNASDLEACVERVGANATTFGATLTPIEAQPDAGRAGESPEYLASVPEERLRELLNRAEGCGTAVAAYLGEWNNPWFIRFPDAFVEANPDAWMRDPSGERVELIRNTKGADETIPVTAVDDPTILRLSSELIAAVVRLLRESSAVASWVVGAEESYPELFGLAASDYRPASLEHFRQWLATFRPGEDHDPARALEETGSPALMAWFTYREQAMADRAARYMSAFLSADRSRPVFYPTHGSLFNRGTRRLLGQPASLMIGATDGLEMGHITIDDDDERLNPMVHAHFGAFGKPLINPRLANKTLDPTAKGGGRSFTPRMLRRLVYECLGYGNWHIGPIHWTSILHDGEWRIKDTPAEAECREVFDQIKRIAPYLQGTARLQPAVGILVSDDTWMKSWKTRWTGLFQDSLSHHWHVSIVCDALVDAELVLRTPTLISVDNDSISDTTLRRLERYLDAGGTILIVGEFASVAAGIAKPETAELRRRVTGHSNAVAVVDAPWADTRVLTVETHNGAGASRWSEEYLAVGIPALEAALGRLGKSDDALPVRVEGEGSADVNVYPLTDRTSVVAVVVNNAGSGRTVRLAPAPALLSTHGRWRCRELITDQEVAYADGAEVTLTSFGVAVIWFHPAVGPDNGRSTVQRASDAVSRWADAGYDVRPISGALTRAEDPRTPPAKQYCAAQSILTTIAVRARCTADGDRAVVTADLADSNGRPVAPASVSVRFTPGLPDRIPLHATSTGGYERTFDRSELPRFYDADRRRYRTYEGPIRIVVSVATADGRVGGSILNVDLPAARRQR